MLWRILSHIPAFYKNQYKTPEELKKFQEKRLRYMVNFAYRNTALYKEKFRKAHITPSDIHTLHDITKIPLVTKEEIKAVYPQGIVTPGCTEENCAVEITSGASGSMLKVLYDLKSLDYLKAVAYRDNLAQGVRPWHKFCVRCSDPMEHEKISKNPFNREIGILEGVPEEEIIEQVKILQPHIMAGHTSSFVAMASVMEKNCIKDIHPLKILLGGEVAYPVYREYIEKVFQCPTSNKYGAYEMYSIAWECNHHNMHISADSVILEFLKDGEPVSPGERGEIVATNLWNKAMPFIRYRLGDVGIPSDCTCPCGRGLPVLQNVEGRADDFIVLPSGEVVPPIRMISPFFTTLHNHIEQFRVIQDTKSHIYVYIVPQEGFTNTVENALLGRIRDSLGSSVDIDMEKVEHLNQSGRSKFRTIISKVGSPL
jgi:phenylacetate-CoA ligase